MTRFSLARILRQLPGMGHRFTIPGATPPTVPFREPPVFDAPPPKDGSGRPSS